MEFIDFVGKIKKNFEYMKSKSDILFYTTRDRNKIWETYLQSFPEGSNPIYKERTEHDCNACKSFIRQFGSIVVIDPSDLKMLSIWDMEIGGSYQDVADAMSRYVKSHPIENIFMHNEKNMGIECNRQEVGGKILKWHHFHLKTPSNILVNKDVINEIKSESRANKEVLYRSLTELTIESAEIVLDLIEQNTLYRGREHKKVVELFIELKKQFNKVPDNLKDHCCWLTSVSFKSLSKIRNTVIGTLLSDLSEGKDIEDAVKAYEFKVAPSNYKRPKAIVTKSMILQAQNTLKDLGLLESLERRYATISDISVNNVLFADRSVKPAMKDVFDELLEQTPEKIKKYDNVEKIHIEKFISDVLPKINTLELFIDNKHLNNLVSLTTAVNQDAPFLFKWPNHCAWSYTGDVADSIKEKVKQAGGKVDGVIRCSLSWYNTDDLDIHVIEPNQNEIYYLNNTSFTSGKLDVDMNASARKAVRGAVENITWNNRNRMLEGNYDLIIHNYKVRERNIDVGFEVEIEHNGHVYSFNYPKHVSHSKPIKVATFYYNPRTDEFKLISSIQSTENIKVIDEWNIKTNHFHKVQLLLMSPNFWDNGNGFGIGNKHYFFMLENCKNPDNCRGFYNEYLKADLTKHRKVFEILGSKMKAPYTDNQLSGIGFSETQKNRVIVKASGSFNRPLELIFQ